jgi:FkbM family methyltransferase
MIPLESNKVFIQIGANNGNDDFNNMVRQYHPSKVILVEPNKELNVELIKNYMGIPNVIIENVAITEKDKGVVELVHPKNVYNKIGKRISKWNYVSLHYSLVPMDDWGSDFDKISAPSMSFTTLCRKHGISDIHYLQVDTEGYDAEIIKSIDFKQIKIDVIKYEDWSFPESAFKRHGAKAKLYGINGMQFVSHMLLNLGYTLSRESGDVVAIKNK